MGKLLVFFFLTVFSISFSTENQINLGKFYLQPEQISVTNNGIFASIKNITVSLDAIYCDSLGLFTYSNLSEKKTCPNGHTSVVWWGGCAIITCPYYAYEMN